MNPWDLLGWGLFAALVLAIAFLILILFIAVRMAIRVDREDREIYHDIDDQRAGIRRQRERFKL